MNLVFFQAIDGADGFQNTHQMKQYESAKFSMDQVSFSIFFCSRDATLFQSDNMLVFVC